MELSMKKKPVYPSKTSLNLCIREKSALPLQRVIPLLLVVLLVVGVFGKFAVADRFEKLNQAESEVYALEDQRNALKLSLRDFDRVMEEYNHYSVSWMDESELSLVSRTEILNLVESMLRPKCQVRQVSVSGNNVSVTLAGITLDDTSKLVQTLYTLDHVSNVAVYTASTKDEEKSEQATVAMVITMGYDKGGVSQ